jgi:hypothetical protein
MRRNPRPIPLDEDYIDELVETMLLGYYRRLVEYRGLPIYRSKLITLQRRLRTKFPIKPCNDYDLEICANYKTKTHNKNLSILGLGGYPRFPVKDLYDVRGVKIPLDEISTRVLVQQDSFHPTDLPFLAAAAIPNQEGLTEFVFVALNGDNSPKDFVDLYENDYDFLFHLLYQIVVHEFTHSRDVIPMSFRGFMAGMSFKEDRNTDVELRARLREIIEDVRKHIKDHGFTWLKENLRTKPMDQVIKKISVPYLMDYDLYTDDSHFYLMGGVHQWLRENGYKIPPRTL